MRSVASDISRSSSNVYRDTGAEFLNPQDFSKIGIGITVDLFNRGNVTQIKSWCYRELWLGTYEQNSGVILWEI